MGRKKNNSPSEDIKIFDSSIFTEAGIGVIGVDLELRYQQWNPVMEKLTHVPATEVIGKKILEVFPYLEETGITQHYQRIFSGQGTTATETVLNDPILKQSFYFSSSYAANRDDRGNIIGATCLLVDITNMKRAESLTKTERDLGLGLGSMSNLDAALSFILDTFFKISGIDSGGIYLVEPRTGALKIIVHKGLSAEFIQLNSFFPAGTEKNQLVMAGKPIYLTRTVLSQRTDIVPLSEGLRMIAVIPIKYDEQVIACLNLASHAIDDIQPEIQAALEAISTQIGGILLRIKMEEALRENEAQLKSIYDSLFDGILMAELDTLRLVRVSANSCQMFGYPEAEFLTKSIRDIHPPGHLADVLGHFQAMAQGKEKIAHDLPFVKKDGSVFWGDIATANPIVIQGKSCLIGFVRDITERKKMLEQKKQLESQLLQAQKMESIGLLAGGIAHDINNMLAPILGNCELLLEENNLEHSFRVNMEEIRKASERARDLTRHLLAFARKQTLQVVSLDLNRLIENFTSIIRRTLRENILVQIKLDPNLEPISGDRPQIEQVILNLVLNAQDAMPEGGMLTIETANVYLGETDLQNHQSISAGPFVRMSIADTGAGMKEEVVERIFEPFYTTKEIGKGSGLGLPTAYGVIHQLGGTITVTSQLGKGSVFHVYFPLSGKPVFSPEVKKNPVSSATGRETILVVEDQDQVRKIVCDMLRRRGYQILEAETGKTAIELARASRDPIDLLITDIVMPDLNGKELYEKLSQEFPRLKVFFMSGYAADVINRPGVLEEGVNFIQKPFLQSDFTRIVREILDK